MARGRPRKTDPECALDAAMAVFWEKGYDGASMSDLVSATGMAKPGLYANFGDKESLYAKALIRYRDRLGQPMLDELAADEGDLEKSIRSILEKAADFVTAGCYPGGCFVTNTLTDGIHLPEQLAQLGRDIDARRRDAFITRFIRAADRGLLAGRDPMQLAEFFSAQVIAMAVLARGGTDRDSLQRHIETALTLLQDAPPAAIKPVSSSSES